MTYIGYTENGKDFLAYYTYKTLEEAKEVAERLNTEKPERLWDGTPAYCNERTYWANEQSMMETC